MGKYENVGDRGRYRKTRQSESLLEKIKHDVKSWFDSDNDDDDDDHYESRDHDSREQGEESYRHVRARRPQQTARRSDSDNWDRGRSAFSRGAHGSDDPRRDPYYDPRAVVRNKWQDDPDDYQRPLDEDGRNEGYDHGSYRRNHNGGWSTPGPFTGTGPKGFRRSPDSLKERVCERLEAHGQLDASNIEIEIKDDDVILTGEVEDRRAKRLAEECCESIAGIDDVHNRLTLNKQR